MPLKPLDVKELPKALPFKKIIGPSFIILGLGLGSGEIILWPYLSSNFGLGIIWGAILGITFQFFMNMEIERYALAHGESVFVGFKRKLRLLPFWFILSTFIPWMWPGIIAASAKFFGYVFGVENTSLLAITFLIVIGLILTFGPILYKTVENLQKILISIGVPSIFILSILLTRQNEWVDLVRGVAGVGEGYLLLPVGIPIASFLAALAYAGAGGNLNLAQAFYIKEKGYGMGKYSGRITSILTGKVEDISLTGARFETNESNLKNFKKWWRNINLEHFIIFWLTGSVTILLLSLLAYSTTYGTAGNAQGVNFVFLESAEIGKRLFPFAGTFFLLVAGSTLFGTQLTVFDASSRIISENIVLAKTSFFRGTHIPKIYYTVLWLQIAMGILIFSLGFTEPLQLVIIAAVLNAFAMFVHSGLTLWLNLTSLDKHIRPNAFRVFAMLLAFMFYGGFSLYVIKDVFFK
ncbi:hypothetical protein C4577_04475 [Candidatus Parcubacteria bacterium]|nr:MAG: hypothetical protein C4577_04475 [Candidatus Parcubacteria bacterium]